MLTALIVAAVAVCLAVALFAWALGRAAARADASAAFEEHARTACALLQPDNPALPDKPSDADLAAEVDALLADLFPTIRRAFPEES